MKLAELIHPTTASQFFGEYWEQRPLLIAGEAERFSGLFSFRDMGCLLRNLHPRARDGMLVVKGSRHYDVNWVNPDGSPRVDKVRDAWRDGYSIVVNGLGQHWEPAASFTASLQEELHHPVNINLYATPPGSQAFDPHYDVMDSFILQLSGSKVWEVRDVGRYLPLPDEHTAIRQESLPPLLLEEELRPGSVLYIPRGHVHTARTTSDASFHLTVGINVVTWMDLFAASVSAVRDDERFRKALPIKFLHETAEMQDRFRSLLDEMPRHLKLDDALGRLAEQLIVQKPPHSASDFLVDEIELAPDTVLVRRAGMICRVMEGAGYAVIQYSGGKIMGPAKIAPALRHIAERQVFSVGSLPGELNEREKLVLARRLIRDGLLEVKSAR
jgi:ribosomal protein L16 Arg81 hydroxylase